MEKTFIGIWGKREIAIFVTQDVLLYSPSMGYIGRNICLKSE